MNQIHEKIPGERIASEVPDDELTSFQKKLKVAASDSAVGFNAFIDLLYGLENPILDKHILPGRAMVTKEIFEKPIYRTMTDLLEQKQIQFAEFSKTSKR